MPGMKWIEPIVFSKRSGNPIFHHIFGQQRAGNEAKDTKMYRGQETHPIRVNARYVMNETNSFFKKFRKPYFRPNIWPPEGRKWGYTNTKMNRDQETYPLGVNDRYVMNWANSLKKKNPETPFSTKYLSTRGQKMRLGTRKWIGVKRLTP